MSPIHLRTLVGLLCLAAIYSCQKKDSGSTAPEANLDSLQVLVQSLTVQYDSAWNDMMADDDNKHFLLLRLVDEVIYTNSADTALAAKLKARVAELKTLRYQRGNMDSPLIDRYDSATSQVIGQVVDFAKAHPRFQDYPLMQELIDEIYTSQNELLHFRIRHDRYAKQLNALLDSLPELFPSGAEPISLFELPA
ncbi:MAG: hypothetical protein HC842_05850 [Cytophagales bacterium]|nr:hypothetical protein [Cytophagales bacterium]